MRRKPGMCVRFPARQGRVSPPVHCRLPPRSADDRRLDRAGLRGAVHRDDVPVPTDVLTGDAWPSDALQMLGEAVLVAAREQVDGFGSPLRCPVP